MEISAAEFKARCLKLMDEIARTRKTIVITKRGKPVAKLVPPDEDIRSPLLGYMSGTVTRMDDVESPTGVAWEADEESEPHLMPSRVKRRGK